jgi:hypothetical protein
VRCGWGNGTVTSPRRLFLWAPAGPPAAAPPVLVRSTSAKKEKEKGQTWVLLSLPSLKPHSSSWANPSARSRLLAPSRSLIESETALCFLRPMLGSLHSNQVEPRLRCPPVHAASLCLPSSPSSTPCRNCHEHLLSPSSFTFQVWCGARSSLVLLTRPPP